MPARLPCLLAARRAAAGRLWLTNARLFAGTDAGVRAAAGVLVADGRVERVGASSDAVPEGARVIDLEGRVLMPGLVDAHVHVKSDVSAPAAGAEPLSPGTSKHFVAAGLRDMLRMGLTTVRDVGSYGDDVVEARRGADFVKVMTTGARSVELEDPDPAQLTGEELATLVQEAHRMGYRVAAHAEGLAGTRLAIEHGIDTIEHGMYLHQRPELLEQMARTGQILVPTLSCFYGVAGTPDPVAARFGAASAPAETWSPLLVELAEYNLEQADRTLRAARAAGVRIAMGYDWNPLGENAIKIVRMVRHGLTAHEALVAATATAAEALGLGGQIGTVEPGKLADLVVLDGDPLADCELLLCRERIWLVIQLGEPVAGAALERDVHAPARAVAAV